MSSSESAVTAVDEQQLLDDSAAAAEAAAAADDDYSGVDWFEWTTEGLMVFIIGNIGLLGNGISVYTFSKQRVHRIFHNLLLVLAIFDIVSL